MKPKLSIIVPAYKTGKTLVRALDSIYRQLDVASGNVEVVAVNDCSPDNVAEILAEYQQLQPSLKVITHETNRREAGAHNTGVENSAGEYFLRLDSDDALRPGAVEKILAVIRRDSPDIILHPFALVNSEGKLISESGLMGEGLFRIDTEEESERKIVFQEVAFGIMTPRVVYRRAAAPNVRQDLAYPISGDRYFGWCFFQKSKTVYLLNEMLVDYYQYPDSMSRLVGERAVAGLLELNVRFWREMQNHPQFSVGGKYAFRRLFPGQIGWHYKLVYENGPILPSLVTPYFESLGVFLEGGVAARELGPCYVLARIAVGLRSRVMVELFIVVYQRLWLRWQRLKHRL